MGQVYVLSNKDLRGGLLKIGCTNGLAHDRAKQLSGSTSIPSSFKVELTIDSNTPEILEKLIHKELGKYRHSKEYFKCSLENAVMEIKNFLILNPNEGSNISGPAAHKFLTYEELEKIKVAKRVAENKKRVAENKKEMAIKEIEDFKYVANGLLEEYAKDFISLALKFNSVAEKQMPNSRKHYNNNRKIPMDSLENVGYKMLGTVGSLFFAAEDLLTSSNKVSMKMWGSEYDMNLTHEELMKYMHEDDKKSLSQLIDCLNNIHSVYLERSEEYDKLRERFKKEGYDESYLNDIGIFDTKKHTSVALQNQYITKFIEKYPHQVLFNTHNTDGELKYYSEFEGSDK